MSYIYIIRELFAIYLAVKMYSQHGILLYILLFINRWYSSEFRLFGTRMFLSEGDVDLAKIAGNHGQRAAVAVIAVDRTHLNCCSYA